MPQPIEPTPVLGDVRVTLRLEELTAISNPEPFGKAEWDLRLLVNGIQRWQTERHISVAEGSSVPVGADIQLDVPAHVNILHVEVLGTERDAFSRDEHAEGQAKLHRVGAFERDRGFTVRLTGKGNPTDLQARFTVQVEEKWIAK